MWVEDFERGNQMFLVECVDALGNCFSTWDTFEEAYAEYERVAQNAIVYKDDVRYVSLFLVLRHQEVR